MLLLFCLLSCVNGMMWIQFASVANIARGYFGVSALAIDWLSMIYSAFPTSHICCCRCLCAAWAVALYINVPGIFPAVRLF